jgi:dolichol-phosphate mannosyltransferase
VHIAVLTLLFEGLGVDFQTGQIVATFTAMTSNFALNNVLTYYDRRLFGWGWIRGWISFVLASSLSAIANIGIATYLFSKARELGWMSHKVIGAPFGLGRLGARGNPPPSQARHPCRSREPRR